MGAGDAGIATGTKIIWDDANATAEAACIAADISVGPPVAGALKGMPLAMPNPDISLRFTGADASTDHLVSTCRLEGITGGLATTSLDVWSGSTLIAVGGFHHHLYEVIEENTNGATTHLGDGADRTAQTRADGCSGARSARQQCAVAH